MAIARDAHDGRPVTGAAIGVVPVCHDDREAPEGCAALRELRGRTLLVWSVDSLLRSGVVGPVTVVVPPALAPRVRDLLTASLVPGADRVEVLPVRENGHGHRLRAALRRVGLIDRRPIVVHDPLYPLAGAALVTAVVNALTGHLEPAGDGARAGNGVPVAAGVAAPGVEGVRCVAAVPVRPVTDTLKWVDQDDVILGTADREHFRMVYSPQAYWPAGLRSVLETATPDQLRAGGADALPRLVQACGGQLLPVPTPGEVFRLTTPEDLVLADAMLHVGVGTEEDAAHRSP